MGGESVPAEEEIFGSLGGEKSKKQNGRGLFKKPKKTLQGENQITRGRTPSHGRAVSSGICNKSADELITG